MSDTVTWDLLQPARLSDGDIISIAIEENVPTMPVGQVEFVLKTPATIGWWKAIQFTDSAGANWEIWTQDNKKSDSHAIEAAKLKDGSLEFKKAKLLGVHTGVYVLKNLAEKLKAGSRVTFYWDKDA